MSELGLGRGKKPLEGGLTRRDFGELTRLVILASWGLFHPETVLMGLPDRPGRFARRNR
jgi:hypothetical protein